MEVPKLAMFIIEYQLGGVLSRIFKVHAEMITMMYNDRQKIDEQDVNWQSSNHDVGTFYFRG